MTTQCYQDASLQLLEQAQLELETGDVRQASKKAWCAAAQAIKAVCQARGWRHDSHALLHQAVERLVDETLDDRIEELFSVAVRLHINFYEHWMSPAAVARGLEAVRRFIDKLDALP